MKETKRQELIRTVESMPLANQRVFSGGYESEWSDWSAWSYLFMVVDNENMVTDDWDEIKTGWPPARFKLRNPSDVFNFAMLLISEQTAK